MTRGIDAKNWRDYDNILTESLWHFPTRDTSLGHEDATSFHGGFIAQIPYQLISRYTQPGDIVLDLFAGYGTSLIEAIKLGRNAYGVEINNNTTGDALRRLWNLPNPHQVHMNIFTLDSAIPNLKNELQKYRVSEADLIILHPPYLDIVKFSDDPSDLSNMKPYDFLQAFRDVTVNTIDLLKPGGYTALVIGDVYIKRQVYPLGFKLMEIMRRYPLELKGIIVKDIQGNERGKGKNKNLWRYRHLKNGTFDFSHEYIFIFQKIIEKS